MHVRRPSHWSLSDPRSCRTGCRCSVPQNFGTLQTARSVPTLGSHVSALQPPAPVPLVSPKVAITNTSDGLSGRTLPLREPAGSAPQVTRGRYFLHTAQNFLGQSWVVCSSTKAILHHTMSTYMQECSLISYRHILPDGAELELVEMGARRDAQTKPAQPPLLFIHGASHGAWCFAVCHMSCKLRSCTCHHYKLCLLCVLTKKSNTTMSALVRMRGRHPFAFLPAYLACQVQSVTFLLHNQMLCLSCAPFPFMPSWPHASAAFILQCYMQENFLPWFAKHGHHCFAVSFRGHGTSSDQSACPDTYAQSNDDLAHVIASLPQPPVLIAHSMGGFFGQRWVAVHAHH